MLETSIQIGNTVYSSFILTFRRYSLNLFVIKNRPIRFISKKYFLGSFMKMFLKIQPNRITFYYKQLSEYRLNLRNVYFEQTINETMLNTLRRFYFYFCTFLYWNNCYASISYVCKQLTNIQNIYCFTFVQSK